jgi:hypothetical protein
MARLASAGYWFHDAKADSFGRIVDINSYCLKSELSKGLLFLPTLPKCAVANPVTEKATVVFPGKYSAVCDQSSSTGYAISAGARVSGILRLRIQPT